MCSGKKHRMPTVAEVMQLSLLTKQVMKIVLERDQQHLVHLWEASFQQRNHCSIQYFDFEPFTKNRLLTDSSFHFLWQRGTRPCSRPPHYHPAPTWWSNPEQWVTLYASDRRGSIVLHVFTLNARASTLETLSGRF